MTTIIEVTNKGTYLNITINGGTRRWNDCFDIARWRARYPGCTIIIDGVLNTYGL